MSDQETRDLARACEAGDPAALARLQRESVRQGRVSRLEFFVAQLPKQKGNSKKIVKFGNRMALIGDKKARAAEDSLTARLVEFRPAVPFQGAVRLDVTFVLPVPAGFPKWKREAALAGRVFPSKRPDRGNLLKLVEDALSGPFVVDDAQIVTGNVAKAYGEIPGYRIVLEELVEATRAGTPAEVTS